MTKEESEELAVRIITDYLKEEKNLQIKNDRHLTKGEDPPDYYFEIGDHRIGCEVTRFSTQGNQFEANSLIDIALEQGRKEFRDSGGPALYVSVHFSRKPETKRQAKDIGKHLAHVVQIMLEHKVKDSRVYSYEFLFTLFSEHELLYNVSNIYFVDSVDGEDELWKTPRAGWVVSVSAEEVQKIIEGKEEELSDYRKNYNSVWLVVHNCLEAGFYEIADEAKQFSYKHGFDRIFWIDSFKVYELRRGSGN